MSFFISSLILFLFNLFLETLDERLQCCSCSEGSELQTNFINHLLSHLSVAKEETLHDESQDAVEEEFTRERIRTKPSYRNRFNRKDRSPETQNIELNFTFDECSKLFHCNFCRNGYKVSKSILLLAIRQKRTTLLKSFKHKQTVERHLSKEHDPRKASKQIRSEEKTLSFHCEYCSTGYKHKQTLERHLAKVHDIRKKEVMTNFKRAAATSNFEELKSTLTCDLCGKVFSFRESLRKHLVNHAHLSTKEVKARAVTEKIVCHLCPAVIRRDLMKRHIQNIHTKYRPFVCQEPGCSTSFTDSSKMNDHKNWHLKIRNYICAFCQEEFYFASNWRQHLYRHVDPERYKCKFCSECFVTRGSLSNHLRLHDDSNSNVSFVCAYEQCDKTFRFESRLKQHFYNVHRTEEEQKCKM